MPKLPRSPSSGRRSGASGGNGAKAAKPPAKPPKQAKNADRDGKGTTLDFEERKVDRAKGSTPAVAIELNEFERGYPRMQLDHLLDVVQMIHDILAKEDPRETRLLAPGTYYVRTYYSGTSSTPYSLRVSSGVSAPGAALVTNTAATSQYAGIVVAPWLSQLRLTPTTSFNSLGVFSDTAIRTNYTLAIGAAA